jgi:hypothetical protein
MQLLFSLVPFFPLISYLAHNMKGSFAYILSLFLAYEKSMNFITVKDERIVNNMFYFKTQNNIIDYTYFRYKNATKHLSLKKKERNVSHNHTRNGIEIKKNYNNGSKHIII